MAIKSPGRKCSISIMVNNPADSIKITGIKMYVYPADTGLVYKTPLTLLSGGSSATDLRVENLSKGTFDMIITKKGCFPWKINNVTLSDSVPDFCDTIPCLTSTANKQVYGEDEILVTFKTGISYKKEKEIILKSGYKEINSCNPRNNESTGRGNEWFLMAPKNNDIPKLVKHFDFLPCVYNAFPGGHAHAD